MAQLDFALITHFETWDRAAAVISLLRGPERPPISREDVREILPWIPPRTSSRVTVGSSQGHIVHGVCVESFIPPDRLERRYLRENLARVREAAQAAIREGARIVTLGGFSSILLEGKTDLLPSHPETAFTTGNTLTVALIVRGVERALEISKPATSARIQCLDRRCERRCRLGLRALSRPSGEALVFVRTESGSIEQTRLRIYGTWESHSG